MKITGHPGLFFLILWPLVSTFLSYLIGRKSKRWRDYFANFATAVELVFMVIMAVTSANNSNPATFGLSGFMGFRIYLVLDGFRAIYGVIAAFMWMMTTLFSREYFAHYRNRNRYYFFMLFTLVGTMGVFLSGDLITTFMFFEMMSFTSYVMVIHDERPGAQEAAKTYMAVAVIGGLAMLFGIFIISTQLHTTEIGALYDAMHHFEGNRSLIYMAAVFMLVGFGGKAGMYPIHIWLPNAHPAAPAPASALLSGVLTKTGIFGILVVSTLIFAHDYTWGMVMLIIGTLGMFTGAMLAVFSIDLKRTLACSSVSQIGFILVGVGMQGILGHHNALAVRGTLLHMVNHSLIKLLLFMAAGVIYMNLHQLDLNKIRGFGRKKPLLAFCFLMGVLAIIGLPFWNGYISKTMLHESIVEQIWLFADYSASSTFFQVIECIFTFTGGMTTAYMIKIFVCIFVEKNQYNHEKMTASNGRYMNKTSAVVLFLCAIIMPILGFNPDLIMIPLSKLGQVFMLGEDPAHAVEFFAWQNVRGAVASLSIGAILYILVIRGCLMKKDEEGRSVYINAWPSAIDIEQRIYRPLLLKVLPFIGAFIGRLIGSAVPAISSLGYRLFMRFRAFWVRNSGGDLIGDTVAEARTFVEAHTSTPILDEKKLRERYQSIFSQTGASSQVIWDGEGDLGASVKQITDTMKRDRLSEADAAQAALPADGHGHSDHEQQEHHVPDADSKQQAEPAPVGFYEWIVYSVRSLYGRLQKTLRIGDRLEEARAGGQNNLLRTVFSSLAYSLLLFLLGFVVFIIFVL